MEHIQKKARKQLKRLGYDFSNPRECFKRTLHTLVTSSLEIIGKENLIQMLKEEIQELE